MRVEHGPPHYLGITLAILAQVLLILIRGSLGLIVFTLIVNYFWRSASAVRVVVMWSAIRLWAIFGQRWFQLLTIGITGAYLSSMPKNMSMDINTLEPKYLESANFWGVSLFYLWIMTAVNRMGGLLATGASLYRHTRGRFVLFSVVWAYPTFSLLPIYLTLYYPGPGAVFGLIGAFIGAAMAACYAMFCIARFRRQGAPLATDTSVFSSFTSIDLLLLSDVHVTQHGSKSAPTKTSGIANLRYVVEKLTHARQPRYILLTGDLVKKATLDEYSIASEFLGKIKVRGTRVLFAPGNHDVGMAYDPDSAWAFLSELHAGPPVDHRKFMQYLCEASRLEPELRCCSGEYLADLTRNELKQVEEFEAHWAKMCKEAAVELRGPNALMILPNSASSNPKVVRLLLEQDPIAGERVLQRILEPTLRLFNPPSIGEGKDATPLLREFLLSSDRCTVHPLLLSARWRHMWYDLFPLWLDVEDGALKFLIVNSVFPEPGLLGSATGLLDREQLTRFREIVKATSSRQLVVLMHHAICRWQQNRADMRTMVPLQRWCLLAHDSDEGREMIDILETESPVSVENILLCTGHRHDIARAGPVKMATNLDGCVWSQRLRILESPSLSQIELQDPYSSVHSHLLACHRSSSGNFVPHRVALTQLALSVAGC